jgi:hypothetical protein
VPVPVRIRIDAIERVIFGVAQRRVAAHVRGGEFGFAGEEHGLY